MGFILNVLQLHKTAGKNLIESNLQRLVTVTSGQNGKAFVSAESRPYHLILSLIFFSPPTNPPGFTADVASLLEIMVQAKRLVTYRLQALGNTNGK